MFKWWYVLTLLASLFGTISARAAGEVEVLFSNMTPAIGISPYALLSGDGKLQLPPRIEFVKVDIALQPSAEVDEIEIASCERAFQDGIDVYFNFNRAFRFIEPGRARALVSVPTEIRKDQLKLITLNFRLNSGFCLKEIAFRSKGTKLQAHVPRFGALSVEAEVGFYRMFSSEFESPWLEAMTNPVAKAKITAKEQISISKLRVWNGDQSSDLHYASTGRVGSIVLQSDSGSREIKVDDIMGEQTLEVTPAVSGKNFRLQVTASVDTKNTPAKNYAVALLQFFDGKNWLVPDPAAFQAERQKAISTQAIRSGLEILDHGLMSLEADETWYFRLHSDGHFFLRGQSDKLRGASAFYILGTYQVVKTASQRMTIVIQGQKKSSPYEMDSSICGRNCADAQDHTLNSEWVEQKIQIRRGKDGYFRFDNLSPSEAQLLKFGAVRMRKIQPFD